MGQAAVLPNPILPEGGDPDDLLARLAGEEIGRLIREAEGETARQADPAVAAALSRAEPAAVRLAAIAEAADRSTAGGVDELRRSAETKSATRAADPFVPAPVAPVWESKYDTGEVASPTVERSVTPTAEVAVPPLESFGLEPMAEAPDSVGWGSSPPSAPGDVRGGDEPHPTLSPDSAADDDAFSADGDRSTDISSDDSAGEALFTAILAGTDLPASDAARANVASVDAKSRDSALTLPAETALHNEVAASPESGGGSIVPASPATVDQASSLRDRMAALSATATSSAPISRPLDSAEAVAREMAIDEATRPGRAIAADESARHVSGPSAEATPSAAPVPVTERPRSSNVGEPIAPPASPSHTPSASADATAFALASPTAHAVSADAASEVAPDPLFDAAHVADVSPAVSATSEALSAILDSTEVAGERVETEPKLAVWWVPLVWLNSPFAFLPESARAAIGKLGLVTLFNATAVLIYATVVKK